MASTKVLSAAHFAVRPAVQTTQVWTGQDGGASQSHRLEGEDLENCQCLFETGSGQYLHLCTW